jgi:hypothetical protein
MGPRADDFSVFDRERLFMLTDALIEPQQQFVRELLSGMQGMGTIDDALEKAQRIRKGEETDETGAFTLATPRLEFQDFCRDIDGMSSIPFRVVDSRDQTIYESREPVDEEGESVLTLDCRHNRKSLFRIICKAGDRNPGQTVNMMFVLKKMGLQHQILLETRDALSGEIDQTYRLLHFFYSLPSLLRRDLDWHELCQLSLERICWVLRAESGSVFLHDAETRSFRAAAITGRKLVKGKLATMNPNIVQWMKENKGPLLVDDVKAHPAFKGRGDYRTPSFIATPLYYHPSMRGEHLAGILNLADPVDRPVFSSHDAKFAFAAGAYAVFLAKTKPERRGKS